MSLKGTWVGDITYGLCMYLLLLRGLERNQQKELRGEFRVGGGSKVRRNTSLWKRNGMSTAPSRL